MSAFYNENDPKAAAWLREIVKRGLVAPGVVDERSITEVQPDELGSYNQVHLFAGIGGWSYALRLAGWPDDRPVWTGSCPCQPFSVAGKGQGSADKRHLWPEMFRLVRARRPLTVFGEQVANAVGHGWIDGVSGDLEGEGYSFGPVVLGAHSVGAPHIRQRLWWVADRSADRRDQERSDGRGGDGRGNPEGRPAGSGLCGASGGVGDSDRPAEARLGPVGPSVEPEQEAGRPRDATAWSDFYLVGCADGKARRVGSGVQPLAHGVPARVGRLRGYGNAIVPQTAAIFIQAYLDTRKEP